MTPKTQLELTADVASWINEIIGNDVRLAFSRAKCEMQAGGFLGGFLKRPDLSLLDGLGRIVTTGGVKLPYQKDGSSPYNSSFVDDARSKALKVSSKYFFTWNVNECVLWETIPGRVHWTDQNYKSWNVIKVGKEGDLENPAAIDALKRWLAVFLNDLAKILWETGLVEKKSPGEKFTDFLESALRMPILVTLDELDTRYKQKNFKSELDILMSADRGWIIHDDPEGIRDNLERVARFACYGFLNKLVFHEALLRRHGARLDKISVPDHIDTGEKLRIHLERYFAEAARITGDHETVFGGDYTSIGNLIPFYSDVSVVYWRELIGRIHGFDFSELDDGVIGSIFERVIGSEERYQFNRFFTKVEIVEPAGPIEEEMVALAEQVEEETTEPAEPIEEEIVAPIGPKEEEIVESAKPIEVETAEPAEPIEVEMVAPAGQKEETAMVTKDKSKRRSRLNPEEIAAEIFGEIKSSYPEMLRQYDPDFLDRQRPFDTFELPVEGDAELYKDLFRKGVIFKKGKRRVGFIEGKNPDQEDLIIDVANAGIRGIVRFPREEDECRRVSDLFAGFVEKRSQVVRELIENRTAGVQMRKKVYAVVTPMILGAFPVSSD